MRGGLAQSEKPTHFAPMSQIRHIRPAPEVIAFAAECFAEDIAVAHVLARAGVAWSTWTRAKKRGQRPHRATMDKMNAALSALVAERDNPRAETGPQIGQH